MRWYHAARFAANAVNLSTPLGLVAASLGRAALSIGPRGLVLATGYSLPVPPATAFTVGNVILTRRTRAELLDRPNLLAHEEHHTWQYVACLGLPMLPLYGLCAAWSQLRAGNYATQNPFERLAGLADGGYPTN